MQVSIQELGISVTGIDARRIEIVVEFPLPLPLLAPLQASGSNGSVVITEARIFRTLSDVTGDETEGQRARSTLEALKLAIGNIEQAVKF